MLKVLRPAVCLLALMTFVLGLAYPAFIAGVARVGFPLRAAGSLVERDGQVVGSRLIGQSFSTPAYFWGRPSATIPYPYDALASTGSNFGPLNPALLERVGVVEAAFDEASGEPHGGIPVDLVTVSASGLDPDITPAGARFQARRVARARGIGLSRIEAAIAAHTQGALLGFIGEPRVNVLEVNLALDAMR